MRNTRLAKAITATTQNAHSLVKRGALVSLLLSALSSPVQATQPDFQMPVGSGSDWQLSADSEKQSPALDITLKTARQAGQERTLLASAVGTVKQVYADLEGDGYIIQIDHGEGWFSSYSQLNSATVKVGDKVQAGQTIGNSGINAQGKPHFRFELSFDMNSDGQADLSPSSIERQLPVFNGQPYNIASNKVTMTALAAEKKYWVDTYKETKGYGATDCDSNIPSMRCKIKGTLNKGTNYVYCKRKGDSVGEGSSHNSWWLLTDLDSYTPGSSGRAYVSAIVLSNWGNDVAKDNSGKNIPLCN